MGGETAGFRVKPDELLAVAQKIDDLLDDVAGNNGATTGNHKDFQMEASKENLSGALNTLFPESGVGSSFVQAYGHEYDGMNMKYTAMVGHLTELATACRSTAEQYGAEDEYTQTAINQVDPTNGTTPPTPGDSTEF
jgi:hypothetical protein